MSDFVRETVLRDGFLDSNRRRYVLTYDSGYPLTRKDFSHRHGRIKVPTKAVQFTDNYRITTTQRPFLEAFESICHTVYSIDACDCDIHLLHLLHALQVIKISGTLAREHSKSCSDVVQDDLPILHYRRKFAQKFDGHTIYHWALRTFYQLLSTKLGPLIDNRYDPLRKSLLRNLKHILNKNLGTVCPAQLSGLIVQQLLYLYNNKRDPAIGAEMTYHNYIRMLGHLHSALLSGLQNRQYRIRLHISNYRFPTLAPVPISERVRIFGCISYESSSLGAHWNRKERYGHFKHVWNNVNSQVLAFI